VLEPENLCSWAERSNHSTRHGCPHPTKTILCMSGCRIKLFFYCTSLDVTVLLVKWSLRSLAVVYRENVILCMLRSEPVEHGVILSTVLPPGLIGPLFTPDAWAAPLSLNHISRSYQSSLSETSKERFDFLTWYCIITSSAASRRRMVNGAVFDELAGKSIAFYT
jgi:hypothetical protein